MAITLDGSVASQATRNSGVNKPTVTFSTSNANDIIVLFQFLEDPNFSAVGVSSISDTNSLAWNLHSKEQFGSGPFLDLEIWWALATSAQTSNTVTVTPNGQWGTNSNSVLAVQGFTGCNTTTPFDTNASIPTTGGAAGPSVPSLSGVSTTNSSDLLLFFAASSNGGATAPSPQTVVTFGGVAGTILVDLDSSTGHDNSHGSLGYLGVSAAQSSITYSFNVSAFWDPWAAIATALQTPSSGDTLSGGQQLVYMKRRSFSNPTFIFDPRRKILRRSNRFLQAKKLGGI